MASRSQSRGSGGVMGTKELYEGTRDRVPEDYMPEDKLKVPSWEAKARFGRAGIPFPATHVYWGLITRFSRKDVLPEHWVIVDEEAGTMSFVNTYNGKTGDNFDRDAATFALESSRLSEKTASKYRLENVEECPVAILASKATKAGIDAPESVPEPEEGIADKEARNAREPKEGKHAHHH